MEKEGDLILLMGNFNYYIISHRYCQYLSKIGLRELITDKHIPKVPGSTRSNKNNNSIDGIWGYPRLALTYCGYLAVTYGLKSDHRLVWVKISVVNALGYKTLPSKTPSARKIRLHNPDGQQKYISKFRHINRQHNLLPRLIELENHHKCPPSPEAIKEYEDIDKILVKARSKSNSSV